MKQLENSDIDFSRFEQMEQKFSELTRAISTTRGDLANAIKEIRQVLFTKADDEAITELENKILFKLNELAENICKKFSDKTETKIGFKNINKQIRDLYSILLNMPGNNNKSQEDDAMLSK
jgi:hypothetical protein